jgi:hemolysin activation/secretion protein
VFDRAVYRLGALVLGAALLDVSVGNWGFAQVAGASGRARPSREELNPAARAAPPPERAPDIFEPAPRGPCPLESSPLKVQLKSVSFRGATSLTPAELAPSYAGLIGSEVPVSALCEIRDRATRLFFDRGVLARVEIPEQRIVGGAVVLEVIEAHVANVRIRGDAGNAQAAVERYLDKLRGMTPFDMRKAQRYLLLASDVPGAQVRASIRPSATGERGAIDLDVIVSARPIDAAVNIQNLEASTIGPWAGLARVDANGLTPFGDRTTLVGYHTLASDEQWLVQLVEEARIGGEGLVARGSFTYGQTRPGGAFEALGLFSTSFVGEVEASYPVVRLRRRNLNLVAGVDVVDETTDTGSVPLFRDKLRVAYLRGEGSVLARAFGRPLLVSGDISARRGVAGLGASRSGDPTLSRPDAEPDAALVRADARVAFGLTPRLQVAALVQGQYTRDRLFSYEQMALGNLTVGRGYDPAVLLGDSGAAGTVEFRYGPLRLRPTLAASPYVFCDVGMIHNNGAGLIRNRALHSVGAGVLFQLADRVNLNLTYARPLDEPIPGFGKPDQRVLVNLQASIF